MAYDAIVIGGGAAGLFCAFTAGRRQKKVLVIEHNADVGRKIIISGGGRCNFTNIHTTAVNFISQNPHFCKSALSRYTPLDFVDLVKKHKLGQLFCRENSRLIVDMLVAECREAGVEIQTGCSVTSVGKTEGSFSIETSQGIFRATQLVIACGGLSFPKIGATDLGYRVARQFGLKITQTRASLVAMVLEDERYKHLAGVSIASEVEVGKLRFRENILFTHRGLSGPAILQASNYWQRGEPMSIDLLPGTDASRLLTDAKKSRQKLSDLLRSLRDASLRTNRCIN
jgi:predicted Rossmann fold flavoprotein